MSFLGRFLSQVRQLENVMKYKLLEPKSMGP